MAGKSRSVSPYHSLLLLPSHTSSYPLLSISLIALFGDCQADSFHAQTEQPQAQLELIWPCVEVWSAHTRISGYLAQEGEARGLVYKFVQPPKATLFSS